MTLIVGVKCSDGIVLGADSTATYVTPLGQPTIRQETATKLHIATDTVGRLVVAVSGPIALGQSYSDEADHYVRSHQNRVTWKNVQEAKTELTKLFWKHAGPTYERAGVVARVIGQAAFNECNHQAAAMFALSDGPHLIGFSGHCNAEEVTTDLPFVSLGSGQVSADPFLAFIRRIFWPVGLPPLLDGKIATIWTLDEVIKHTPGGVGGNVRVAALAQDQQGDWKCSELSAQEIEDHRQVLSRMEDKMREALTLQVSEAAAIPEPPTTVEGPTQN
jgi:hypothetical protein